MSNLAGLSLEDPGQLRPTKHESEKQQHDDVAPYFVSDVPMNQVPLAEFHYYAKLQRDFEESRHAHSNQAISDNSSGSNGSSDEKTEMRDANEVQISSDDNDDLQYQGLNADQKDKLNARRALRTATAAAVFFLITTDILGPNGAPYAMSQVGYVPGNILYFVFGCAAGYTGLVLWRLFLALDSARYPVKTYSDISERIFGRWARHVVTVLQSLQLIVNVGVICLSNAQSLDQLDKGSFCFAGAIVIWAALGMIIAQIRSLKNYGWIANLAVWMNVAIMIISIPAMVHFGVNYAAASSAYGYKAPYPPVEATAFVSQPITAKVNGIMNLVFAYGGAMIFPELISEMRRPMDFWKGMAVAQIFIYVVYTVYASVVYRYQGQYTQSLSYYGISATSYTGYVLQSICNGLAIATGVAAAGLYGNIGIKVAYINIVEDWFNGPPLMSRKGRYIWVVMSCTYWALAFVVGAAVPQVQTLSGLIAAIAIQQFTYSFPPLLWLGHAMATDAAEIEGAWEPGKEYVRYDTWKSAARWKRAIFGGTFTFSFRGKQYSMPKVIPKLFNLLLSLAGFTLAGLGMYGSGESVKDTFHNGGAATSFGCKSATG